ncbi:hypothetical protein QNI19_08320 [Cytophagaceae bacterium DM2B3-1]|uniref:Uncharacterized protein n=1 Tax=Xanthocytophaga flava TaxID=3048013 RepID=A0ABT7CGS9_9BACT|nr:hypothetical protein [Xanthocytophaga flavus]MDJ1492933.1 hypothetical protein [Xanthocytophaga flavus]
MDALLNFFTNLIQSILGKSGDTVNKLEILLENARKRLKTVQETYYVKFKKDPDSFLSQTGALWFARKDLEAARYYATGGKEGYAVSDKADAVSALTKLDPRFSSLLQDIQETEIQMQEMENAKGFFFAGIKDNSIFYKDIRTRRELSARESSEV